MKHITSKLLSLLLCLAMLMSMVPEAYADVETEGASGKNTPTETNGGASEQDDAYDDAPDTAVVQSTPRPPMLPKSAKRATPPSTMPSRQRRTATP